MKIKIEKKYLIIPANIHAVSKKLCFYEGEGENRKLVMDFDCKLDFLTPDYWGYMDVSAFMGKELEYECKPDMEFSLEQTDVKEIDGVYREEYRPFIHYTPKMGYNNDPNGLIKYHGTYHLFHQYNPYDTEWGNMHWGHATSTDLLHWEEGDIALFPDTFGTMYSGSAIEDVHNVTGLQSGELPPMLLYYTGAADRNLLSIEKKRTQCLAYSLDGGRSFLKYEGNPRIDTFRNWTWNRDPKVVWVEEIEKYVMMLYLGADQFGLFTSADLLEWSFLQQVTIAKEAECADIFPYTVNGTKYWVLLGASDIYIVGVFENGRFVQKTQEKQLNVALNKVEGGWDEEKLGALLAELGDDATLTGFSQAEIDSLTNDIDSLIDTGTVEDELAAIEELFNVSLTFSKADQDDLKAYVKDFGKESLVEVILQKVKGEI